MGIADRQVAGGPVLVHVPVRTEKYRTMIVCHKHRDMELPCVKCELDMYRKVLKFISDGLLNLTVERKTVGYGPPRVGFNHCLSCWSDEARRRAKAVTEKGFGE